MNRKLIRQANDLLIRLCDAKAELYHQAQTMPYDQYKRQSQRLEHAAARSFDRLLRRTRRAATTTKQ